MNANVSKSMNEQISQQELQYLITVSTGFIDAYIIECHGKNPCSCRKILYFQRSIVIRK
jgi:hypothetical protein